MPTINVKVTYKDGVEFSVDKDPVQVPRGNATTTIVWTFSSDSSPGVQFTNQGIKFKVPPPQGRKQWNQSTQPSGNATQWSLDDLNNSSGAAGLYAYAVNVRFNNTNKTLDPDIENQIPPGEDDDDQGGKKPPKP